MTIGAMTHISTLLDRFVEVLLQQRRAESARDEARGHGADQNGAAHAKCDDSRVGTQDGADDGNAAIAHGSGCLGLRLGLHAQDIPRDIGAQVLAADLAGGGALNLGAALSGNAALAVLPLTDSGRTHAKPVGKRGSRAEHGNRALDGG